MEFDNSLTTCLSRSLILVLGLHIQGARKVRQVAKLWQRDRATHAPVQGWVTLRLNFMLNSYVLRQYLWTVRWANGYTTAAAGSFHTKKFRSRLYSIEIEFYSKIF